MAPTRWKLRTAIVRVNEILSALKVTQHPDKTFIGRIERGFDFLGYAFSPAGMAVATRTIRKFVERTSQLYEQDALRIGDYVRRWLIWVKSGVPLITKGVGGCWHGAT